MSSEKAKNDIQRSWEEAARNRPKRTVDTVGKLCAAEGCPRSDGVSSTKPLCYPCWLSFDRLEIFECDRCHWFSQVVFDADEYLHPWKEQYETLCFDCMKGREIPIYVHGPVEHQLRYLYILKLDGGKYYVGQTNDVELRLQEHRDGLTKSTSGKNPRLVFFEEWKGSKEDLNEEEDSLTQLNAKNPRVIRRLVNNWQRLMRLVAIEN